MVMFVSPKLVHGGPKAACEQIKRSNSFKLLFAQNDIK